MAQGCNILTRHRKYKIKILGHGLEKIKQSQQISNPLSIPCTTEKIKKEIL